MNLTIYLRAGYPGLAVISSEEARAEAEIASACHSLNKPKMATPYSGLVVFPLWWFNPATRIGSPPIGAGSPFSDVVPGIGILQIIRNSAIRAACRERSEI